MPGLEQQLVYRIDCDKHSTLGGAPPILVLQKDSVQPPILILSGMQTNPPRTPGTVSAFDDFTLYLHSLLKVIKDERRNKSQGYIVQDERKPPPPTPPVNGPSNHLAAGTLPYVTAGRGETNYSPYQQPNGPTDPSALHDPSYFGPRTPSGYPDSGTSSTHWGFGGPQQQQQQLALHSPYLSSGNDGPITPGGGFGPYHRQGPWAGQQPSSFGGDGGPSGIAATPTLTYASAGRPPPPCNNGMLTYHQQEADPYQHPWHNNNSGLDNQQQHQPPIPSPFFQRLAHHPPATVQQPTVIHGDSKRSRSVSFAPLPNYVST